MCIVHWISMLVTQSLYRLIQYQTGIYHMLRIVTLKASSIPCDDHITFSKKGLFLFFILFILSIFLSLNYCIIIIIIIILSFPFLEGGGGGERLFAESLETLASPVFHPLTFKKNNIGFQGFP